MLRNQALGTADTNYARREEPSFLQPATLRMEFGLLKTELRRIGVDCVGYSEDYHGRYMHIGNDINDTQLGTYLLIASLYYLWG